MPLLPDFALTARDDDEGLFSRNIDGQLVRVDAPSDADYHKLVNIQINGRPVQAPLAEPLKDSQGNIVLDINGRTTPRYTTILDAIVKLNLERNDGEEEVFIPTLCHQPHMTPVAVCRACVVQVWGQRGGKRTPERKLLPACQHQVKDGMEVFTKDAPGRDGERVARAVRVVTELLMSDHLNPSSAASQAGEAAFNELQQMADLCGLKHSRFSASELATGVSSARVAESRGRRALDSSSPVFLVDHSNCILCERCIRACDEVVKNNVIGRTGKGRTAGIAFDLNNAMFESSCVQCGECMVSCPTSAITFKPLENAGVNGRRSAETVPLPELRRDPLFSAVPAKFLLWQKDLVLRRGLNAGDVLCRAGEPGHSAFLIKRGRLQITPRGVAPILQTPDDVIMGEMACLSGTPRTADVSAFEDGEVWEVRRNVLDRMMRSPAGRGLFERLYRERALAAALSTSELFANLSAGERAHVTEFLKSRLEFVRVNPRRTIFQQGDLADCLYIVRLGHVRVGIERYGQEATVLYLGPGTVMGEIGLLALSPEDAGKSPQDVDRELSALLHAGASIPSGERTATCLALDHVELARIGRSAFLDAIGQFSGLRMNLIRMALNRLAENLQQDTRYMRQFIEQGLYQGQSLLVLDLNRCTRCDECTRACVQRHGTQSHGEPVTRLLRDGLRFADFLVATSCRSCKDAYCMIGCPVDAIHRGKHQQIVIEDHCIGCGLCSRNCPYGNIFMAQDVRSPVARLKAATCDLCDAEGREDHPTPRCVYACPHDAAHRMTGDQLLRAVNSI